MKSYTRKEYLKGFVNGFAHKVDHCWSIASNKRQCTCLRSFGNTLKAYEHCTNCLGRGIPPIPWSELI